MKKALLLPFRLLNSVPFGIVLMALTAAFVAAGSARPWFREMGVDEWPLLRDWFDKTDMQFFNAWPLKTLMILLVMNLITVTWRRIPLTPPRYGVWCIHAGIITLICGTSLYYNRKVEGRIRIFKDPLLGPTSVDHFYDKDQRSLYVRIGPEEPIEIPLPTLPRFKEYDDTHGGANRLASRGLTGICPTMEVTDSGTGDKRMENIAQFIGCTGQLKFDVIGFYPYANVIPNFGTDPASQITGVDVTMKWADDQQMADAAAPGQSAIEQWTLAGTDAEHSTLPESVLLQSQGQRARIKIGLDVQHVEGNPAMVEAMSKAVGELFHLDVTLPDQKPVPLDVAIGKTYKVGDTGYSLQIQRFDPNFPTFETGEPVNLLTVIVSSPTATFRRSVMEGRSTITDFKLNGKMREQKPIDPGLKIAFRVNDPFRLLPQQNNIKHTLITTAESGKLVDLVAGVGAVASEARVFDKGVEDVDIPMPNPDADAPFAGPMMQAAATQPVPEQKPMFTLHIERREHLKMQDQLAVVPASARDKNTEDEGSMQVAKLKVSLGDWSTTVLAPFADEPGDRLTPDQWHGGTFKPPGAVAPLQVQLGYTRRPLPVRLSLDGFTLVPYPGAPADAPNTMYLDFISTVTMTELDSGTSTTEKAHMNHPIYYGDGDWLFFQATYDPSPEHAWTGLGIGNRPARGLMWSGFIMIVIGLAYAFYLKPVIIRRMKQKAIEKAIAEGKTIRKEKTRDLVTS